MPFFIIPAYSAACKHFPAALPQIATRLLPDCYQMEPLFSIQPQGFRQLLFFSAGCLVADFPPRLLPAFRDTRFSQAVQRFSLGFCTLLKTENAAVKFKRRTKPHEEVPFSGACSGHDHVPGHGQRGAKDFADDSDIDYKAAVDVISELGVVDGYSDDTFRPDGLLTRGAAAKIICNLILGPTTASALSASTAPFKDVPTTNVFAGYITYCAQQGIISGYGDGTFRPTGTLSGNAFMKMLLGALGYDSSIEHYTGANWQVNVIKQASGIGLDDGNDNFVGSNPVTAARLPCMPSTCCRPPWWSMTSRTPSLSATSPSTPPLPVRKWPTPAMKALRRTTRCSSLSGISPTSPSARHL